jgi:hypothetical protein
VNIDQVLLPDGPPQTFWGDQTVDEHTYHVPCQHPAASADNPGTKDKPFATINLAANHYSLIELLVSSQIFSWAFLLLVDCLYHKLIAVLSSNF